MVVARISIPTVSRFNLGTVVARISTPTALKLSFTYVYK